MSDVKEKVELVELLINWRKSGKVRNKIVDQLDDLILELGREIKDEK